MGRGLSADSRQLIQRAYEVLAVEHPSGVRRVADALFGNQASREVKKLGRLLTRARKTGEIPWEWINDSTRTKLRPFVCERHRRPCAPPSACVPATTRGLSSRCRIEVWPEKTVGGTLGPVLERFLVEFQVHHGNTSTM